ncbi:MAG: hypothetical protein QOH06_10 [Acidobacteriota bacterium]|jgi:tetratricopeptide (TPR) repeat protein|nr:hypothetical protein [Acidobacteriota bacterium]
MNQPTFLTDLSSYAHRSLPRLSAVERRRFLKAWRLLGAGGILAVTRQGDLALLGPGVCEALLARSWAARHHDPGQMLHLASVARDVAARLRARDLDRADMVALQARAWGELANAFRVAGQPPAAKAAFEEAFGRSKEVSDPHLSAHLLDLRATLHAEMGELDSATRLLSIVTGVYDQTHERSLSGRARITHSIYAALGGRNGDALRLSEEGLARIEPAQDPVLVMTALHNRLLLALRIGARDEARKTLALCRGIRGMRGIRGIEEEPSSAVALRLRWMEGRVLQDLGEDGLSALGLKLSGEEWRHA